MHGFAQIVSPLSSVLQKDKFTYTSEDATTFSQLKLALTSSPVLALPKFSKPFTIETDASGPRIGAVLLQDGHPIAYFRKNLNNRMQQASTYVRELFAITKVVAKWQQYLLGNHFTIRTYQRSIKRS